MKTKIITQDIANIDFKALLESHNFAGRIAVVYKECDNNLADVAVRAIEKAGSLIKRIAYPSDVLVGEGALSDILSLPDDVRFMVAIGDKSISELAACGEREYILILSRLNTAEYLSPKVMLDGTLDNLACHAPVAVFIDKGAIAASAKNLAIAYACIISHYSILPDMWYNNCFRAIDNNYLEGISAVLQRLSASVIERNCPDSIERIIKANIDLTQLNAAAMGDERAVFISARYATMDITQELDGAELAALWTAYIYNYLSRFLIVYGENLRLPTDLAELADELSRQSGIDVSEIIRRMPRIETADIMTRDYVLIEYKDDLCEKINSKLNAVNLAIKQLKRLYDDAGYNLSRAIKTSELRRKFLVATTVLPMYTLPKHLCLMGIFN